MLSLVPFLFMQHKQLNTKKKKNYKQTKRKPNWEKKICSFILFFFCLLQSTIEQQKGHTAVSKSRLQIIAPGDLNKVFTAPLQGMAIRVFYERDTAGTELEQFWVRQDVHASPEDGFKS